MKKIPAATADDHNMAVDAEGNTLPYSPTEVRAIVLKMIEEGDILAVIMKVKNDLAVQVFGPPSREILECLETTTRSYRKALRGH